MDTLLAVADAQADQEDYFLDFDAGADVDAGVEDFDFKLDGTFDDQAPGVSVETDAGSAAKATADFEIGYEDDEAAVPTKDDTTKTGDAEDDVNQDLGAEYQDEIGYEDEEPDTNGAVADSRAAGSGSPATGQESVVQEHDEPEVVDDPIPNDGFDELDGEDMSAFDIAADAPADTTDGASTHQSQPDYAQTPASGLGDLQGTPADVSSTSLASSVPDIFVHYNQGRYALIGAPSDDPDSCFFSDTKGLDGSLSQLLSSIRDVISDEVSPEDELVIRIDALDLEFGEKSSEKFLHRSFSEILRCFSTLFGDSENEAQELEFDLVIRRDCETRFIELLEEAGLADEPADRSTGSAEDDAFDAEDVSIDDFQHDFQPGEGLVDATTGHDSSAAAEQDRKVATPHVVPQNGEETMDVPLDVQTNKSGSESAGSGQFDATNENMFEEEYLEIHSEPPNEMDEGYELEDVDATDDLDEALAAEEIFDEQDLAIDITEQSVIEQGADNWSGEVSGQDGISNGEVSIAGEVGITDMLEPTLHDHNVAPSFGPDSTLATIHEQEAAGNFESNGVHSEGSSLSMDNAVPGEVTVVGTEEIKSLHTSRTSTINGDEAGYDEHSAIDHVPSTQSLEQPQTPADEIDWENDGEGDGEQDVAVPTPSGKRSRTNETDGLSDGTDNKRRRT